MHPERLLAFVGMVLFRGWVSLLMTMRYRVEAGAVVQFAVLAKADLPRSCHPLDVKHPAPHPLNL